MDQNNPIFASVNEDLFILEISKKDLDLIFKFLSRSDIKGFEITEFNKILEVLNPIKLKKKI